MVTIEIAPPTISEGLASGTSTFQTICQGVAPMDCAASITPNGTSLIEDSTMRATYGAAATVSGTIIAVVPDCLACDCACHRGNHDREDEERDRAQDVDNHAEHRVQHGHRADAAFIGHDQQQAERQAYQIGNHGRNDDHI